MIRNYIHATDMPKIFQIEMWPFEIFQNVGTPVAITWRHWSSITWPFNPPTRNILRWNQRESRSDDRLRRYGHLKFSRNRGRSLRRLLYWCHILNFATFLARSKKLKIRCRREAAECFVLVLKCSMRIKPSTIDQLYKLFCALFLTCTGAIVVTPVCSLVRYAQLKIFTS